MPMMFDMIKFPIAVLIKGSLLGWVAKDTVTSVNFFAYKSTDIEY